MTEPLPMSLLFLGKKGDPHCLSALQFCEGAFARVQSHLGAWKEPLPEAARRFEGEWIVSYLSRWVLPDELLTRASRGAINFHPASPEYPGIGCANFALYEDAQEYGATCHHMAGVVDTGDIVKVRRFPVLPTDDVASLLARTGDEQMTLFHEVMADILAGRPLPSSSERWSRRPFTRKQLNELSRLTPDMSEEELRRRVRATSFASWQPAIELHGLRFVYDPKRTSID